MTEIGNARLQLRIGQSLSTGISAKQSWLEFWYGPRRAFLDLSLCLGEQDVHTALMNWGHRRRCSTKYCCLKNQLPGQIGMWSSFRSWIRWNCLHNWSQQQFRLAYQEPKWDQASKRMIESEQEHCLIAAPCQKAMSGSICGQPCSGRSWLPSRAGSIYYHPSCTVPFSLHFAVSVLISWLHSSPS